LLLSWNGRDNVKKRQVLVKSGDEVKSVILCPTNVTPDGKYIRVGTFWSDEIEGYYELSELEDNILAIVKVFEDEPMMIKDDKEKLVMWILAAAEVVQFSLIVFIAIKVW